MPEKFITLYKIELPTFPGFSLPTSNTTYTPNQFFDVCLPHCSRGCIRLVAYLIRKTLGWCDPDGNPLHEIVAASYRELETKAGLGHSMIRQALDEAQQRHFIRCVEEGRAGTRFNAARRSTFELMWDDSGRYIKDPNQFQGFFAGDGNRTYIPNQFFDDLVPTQSLAMIKVVGAIIRFSIGFQNKYGHRRQHADLSYRDIQRYAKIASPSILTKTIYEAMGKNFIYTAKKGHFDPNGGLTSRSAHYAIKWAQPSPDSLNTPKSVAANLDVEIHSEKVSGSTPKSSAVKHSEKFSGIQIKENKTNKQKLLEVVGEAAVAFERLRKEGFDMKAARSLALNHSLEVIEKQIGWIDQRRIRKSRLGMLRAAIEQNWASPATIGRLTGPNASRQFGKTFSGAIEAVRRKLLDDSHPDFKP